MAPLVSLIITNYNREQYLAAAIESVLAQTDPGFELVIWDDGSSDRSVAVAQDYAQQDQRIRVIAAPHQGIARARKAAITQTAGTYIGWVDSDDWLAPTTLAETVSILNAHPETGMVYTDYLDVDAHGQVTGYGKRCAIPYAAERLLVDFMTFHFRLLRRSVYEQVGGIDELFQYVYDYDLCLRISEVTQIERVQKPLYYYRNHPHSRSAEVGQQRILWSQWAIARALKRRGLSDRYDVQVAPDGTFKLHRKSSPQQRIVACVSSFLIALPVVQAFSAQAQTITPANDGTGTSVIQNGNQIDIGGGRLSGNGANLFHSFDQFGLSQGQIANFLSNPQIQNILGRIGGGSPSFINGLLQVTGSNANLYLMNPAGIVFGTSASLNVPGAFTATTATGIGFGNGWFNATGPLDATSLNGNPTAFAFGTAQPGAIANAGNLTVGPGQNLNLLGGTVLNTGQLTAPGGNITVMAVPGNNLVRLSQPGSLLSLELVPFAAPSPLAAPPPTLPQLLTGGNLTSATGITTNPDGSIRLSGSTLNLPTTTGTSLVSGSLNVSGQTGGTVQLLGDRVGVVGANINATGIGNGGTVRIGGEYRGQGILPNAQTTFVDPTSAIAANSAVNGNGGRVIVWADDTTRFFGTIAAQGGSQSGNGGFVEISGRNFLTFDGTVNVTAANGSAGTVLFDPTTLTIIDAVTGGTLDGLLPDIFAADPDAGANTVSWGQLAALGTGANILLEATGLITVGAITGATGFPTTAPGIARLNLGGDGSLTIRSTGGAVVFANPTDTIATDKGAVTISGTSLNLGRIDTSPTQFAFTPGDSAGNITLTATGDIITGDLIGNGYGFGEGAIAGNTITVRSLTGRIVTGAIAATGDPGSPGSIEGGTVILTTGANGGDITFQSIDARAVAGFFADDTGGGSVTINARGMVRGTDTITSLRTTTIATGGTGTGQTGTVNITHDGGPNNLPFVVNDTSITVNSGNGLFGNINTGAETITNQTFPFSPTPFVSPGGTATITFTNVGPTLTANSSLTGATQNQPFNFTTATLDPIRSDANADNPDVITVSAIATGASLRINGTPVTPGTILPPGATLEFLPPPGFVGTLNDALVLSVTDGIETTSQAVTLDVAPPPISGGGGGNPTRPIRGPRRSVCILTNCTTIQVVVEPVVTLSAQTTMELTPDRSFTDEFAAYLGVPLPPIQSLDAQRDLLQTIEQATGAKPAIVYVSFVPELFRFGNNKIDELPTDQLELVVVTPTGKPVRIRVPNATRSVVLAQAEQFRAEVSDPRKTRSQSYLPFAQQFYQWIITPITPTLKEQGINNLVFIMDAGLRSLPMAALHNGQGFLIENYSLGVMPSISLTDTRYQDIRGVKVLGLGISESTQNQPPLPAVPVEVSTVVNNIWTGREALNSSVTLENLQAFRREQPFGIIHLATHADFQPGAIGNSYIQLWDEKLRLDQVRQLGWNNPQIELLVLSACATALGNREAELGFGGLAVQTGVKTALASLWYVSDAATTALMTAFYNDLKEARIKSEALRRAQLAMARGQVTVEDGKLRGLGPTDIPLPPESAAVRDRLLSHPYYWSAFTIIGSPW